MKDARHIRPVSGFGNVVIVQVDTEESDKDVKDHSETKIEKDEVHGDPALVDGKRNNDPGDSFKDRGGDFHKPHIRNSKKTEESMTRMK